MAITIEATYENGVLKPSEPLPFREDEKLQITIRSAADVVQETYGLLRWTGDPEVVRRIAEDDEFGILEAR